MPRMAAGDLATLFLYKFVATLGKPIIHLGGRASPEVLLAKAAPYLGYVAAATEPA